MKLNKKNLLTAAILFAAVLFMSPLKAQVTIGELTAPDPSAVLDLRSNNKWGLLLPRVNLNSTTDYHPLAGHVKGMLVYNLAPAGTAPTNVVQGIYYNDGTQWVLVGATSRGAADADAIVGNEVKDATDITLTRSGAGTDVIPYTLARAAITGDVSIPAASNMATVTAIQGQAVPATPAPTSGQTQAGWLATFETAFGINSLPITTTGLNNCAFGNLTLNANTSGLSNSAFGATALMNNTTGGLNNVLGMARLQKIL